MKRWKRIRTQTDINELLNKYGSFHDSCLVSATYQSDTSVDDKLVMSFGDVEDYSLMVMFKRQWRPKTLEMRFVGLQKLKINNLMTDIYEASIAFDENLISVESNKMIIWSDSEFIAEGLQRVVADLSANYIVANSLEYHVIDD